MTAAVAVLGPGPLGALLARLVAANGRPVAWWAGGVPLGPEHGAPDAPDEIRTAGFSPRPARPAGPRPERRGSVAESGPDLPRRPTERRARRRSAAEASADIPGVQLAAGPAEALGDAPLVLLAMPAGTLPALLARIGERLTPERLVVHAAKGLDGPAGRRPSEVIAAEASARRVGALGGPYLVAEVLEGYATTLVVGSRFDEVIRAVRDAVASERVRVAGTHDLTGVELAGATVVALGAAAGLCAGLRLGAGARAVVLARALAEASRIGQKLGAQPETFGGPAGVGDLLVTAGDAEGLGYRYGRRVGSGEPAAEVRADSGERTEAVRALEGWAALAARAGLPAPTLAALREALLGGADPRSLIDRCLREPG